MRIKILTLILTSFLLSSCETTMQNGYEIDTQNKMSVHKAHLSMDKSLWSRILVVKYADYMDSGHLIQKDFCIYRAVNGRLYSYTTEGSTPLRSDGSSALLIAIELIGDKDLIEEAWYEDTKEVSMETQNENKQDVENIINHRSLLSDLLSNGEIEWCKIMKVAHSTSGLSGLKSSTYCVYKSKNGSIFVYNGSSTLGVLGEGINPVEVAEQLNQGVVFAWYED